MAGSRTLGSTSVACEDVGRMLGFVSPPPFFFFGGETSAVSLDVGNMDDGDLLRVTAPCLYF